MESNFAGKAAGYSNYPLFNAPEQLATDLKELGFDVMATANNHCLDKGFSGMVNTLAELDKAGIEHYGTYATEEDSEKYLIKDVNGIKIAFLDYNYGTNGIALPEGKEWAISMIDRDKIKTDIDNVKKENVDVVCVNMHWGQEYRLTPTDEQKELSDFLFKNGVDIILGNHPHVFEPMEKRTVTLEDGTTKNGFIIYSLGNFCYGGNKNPENRTIIYQMNLTIDTKTYELTKEESNIIPCYVYTTKTNNYQPAPIEDETIKNKVLNFMNGKEDSPV